MLEVLAFVKDRIVSIKESMELYEKREDEKGYLTREEELLYWGFVSQFNELERLVDFIETHLPQ